MLQGRTSVKLRGKFRRHYTIFSCARCKGIKENIWVINPSELAFIRVNASMGALRVHQHPCFSMLWVLIPIFFWQVFLLYTFREKKICISKNCTFVQKINPSTHALKFLSRSCSLIMSERHVAEFKFPLDYYKKYLSLAAGLGTIIFQCES